MTAIVLELKRGTIFIIIPFATDIVAELLKVMEEPVLVSITDPPAPPVVAPVILGQPVPVASYIFLLRVGLVVAPVNVRISIAGLIELVFPFEQVVWPEVPQ